MAIPGYYSLLQRGSSGPDVALVQTWLNGVRDACTWYDALKADGKFGNQTSLALIAFQRANGLSKDGDAGPLTQQALFALARNKGGSSSGGSSGSSSGSSSHTTAIAPLSKTSRIN